jgi:phospholipid/cholesterol/gamma-HCH transport system substrate-binding protein
LEQATSTLNTVRRFADVLTPTAVNLLPAVGKIPAANKATEALAGPNASSCGVNSTCAIVGGQIRPFVRAARPVVRNLRPAAVNLAAATPGLTKTFNVLNHLFNMLGFYPGTSQHGYLWWLAWLDHNARTLFSVQDANGDFRPLFLQANCATLAQIATNLTGSEALLNLTPILTNAGLCPKQAAADERAYQAYQQRQSQGKSAPSPSSGTNGSGTSNNGPSTSNLFYPKLPTS